MLTDKDFDDIGKRLYDLEAEPPEKGWEKIAANVIPPPPGPGKRTFLGRHWWKGLLLIVPLSIYLVWPEETLVNQDGNNLSALSSEITEPKPDESANPDAEPRGNSVSVPEGASPESSPVRESGNSKNGSGQESGINDPTSLTSERRNDADAEVPAKSRERYPAATAESQADTSPSDVYNASGIDHKTTISEADHSPAKNGGTVSKEMNNSKAERPTTPSLQETETDEQVDFSRDNEVVVSERLTESVDSVTPSREAATPRADIMSNVTVRDETEVKQENISKNSNTSSEGISANDSSTRAAGGANQVLAAIDSAETPGHVDPIISRDHKVADESEENEKGKRESTWRLSAAVTPQFSYKAVTPVGNDEVLVTNISTRSSYPERAGFGFAIGAGKEVLRNLYLDAQLTYTRASQTIAFTYATGKVDTLLAVQGQDGNVRVIPVYQVSDREQKSTLGYGGIRMTVTHYFWSRGKRRFNIMAGAGMNLMVSNKFEEKVNGTWIKYEDLPLNRTNYHLTLGAGYSVAFGDGWEVMFSPMLTHYTKSHGTSQMPFTLNHRSYGLNILFSKFLR